MRLVSILNESATLVTVMGNRVENQSKPRFLPTYNKNIIDQISEPDDSDAGIKARNIKWRYQKKQQTNGLLNTVRVTRIKPIN